jgi:cell division protein FtsL
MDNSNHSSITSLAGAVLVVLCIFITTPILLGMYLDIHETKYKVEKKIKELDLKIEKFNKEKQHGRTNEKEVDLSNGSDLHGN